MNMNNLQTFIQENQVGELKRMNVAFQQLARSNDLKLVVGTMDYWDVGGEVEQGQSVEVSDVFDSTLKFLGATMEPSLDELNQLFYQDNQHDDVPVRIVSPEATYTGTVGIGNMSKMTSLWMDTTELTKVLL